MSGNLPGDAIQVGVRDWCHYHLRPFKPDWPRGFPLAIVRLFQECTKDERFWPLCETDTIDSQEAQIELGLSKIRPACCWLPKRVMSEIYREAGVVDVELLALPRPERRQLQRLRNKPIQEG